MGSSGVKLGRQHSSRVINVVFLCLIELSTNWLFLIFKRDCAKIFLMFIITSWNCSKSETKQKKKQTNKLACCKLIDPLSYWQGLSKKTLVHDFVCFFFLGCCIIFAITKKKHVVQSAFITKLIEKQVILKSPSFSISWRLQWLNVYSQIQYCNSKVYFVYKY